MPPLLYVWFWSLDLFDVVCPRELYLKGEDAVRAALDAKAREEEGGASTGVEETRAEARERASLQGS